MEKIRVVVICGPTATGKTKLSVELCRKFSGEVVNADSMQVYRMLDIGSAKPGERERGGIPHHMMDVVDPAQSFNVSDYCKMAGECIADINKRGKLPFLVGGTGLYIDSLIGGVDFSPIENDYEYRAALSLRIKNEGTAPLYTELLKIDPSSAEKININDEKRIIRALEIYHVTGKTKSYFSECSKLQESRYAPLYIGLNYHDRALMYERIRARVDEMMRAGLLEEVNTLSRIDGFLSSTASRGIGYKEVFPFLRGEETLENTIESIKRASTRYAKRQLTWFRRNNDINWLYADGDGGFEAMRRDAEKLVGEFLK
ncbi:MAG: tRNA (adenosine(37)-N6)-dimethylallyltransferase MiaA [Clostridia bacterium]|nr:tRNA (adenosine(37)-N6)-dimethylallyltransferase MiaA [Clostridia bacterium]